MIKIIKGENLEIKMDVETEYENHRFETFFTKEPETISWIKSLFKPNDIFFDIGANVGIYSLFARSVFGDKIKIFSFEPAYHNFEKLCRNIILNKFKKFFTPYCVAIGETTRFDIMNLASHVSGSASSMLSTAPKYLIENFASEFSQGVFSVTLDDLFENYEFPCPQHIKIDIDGFEEKVIAGGCDILTDGNLKSVLIEITDFDGSKERIKKIMHSAGFTSDHPINYQRDHSRERRQKSGKGMIENIIFTR